MVELENCLLILDNVCAWLRYYMDCGIVLGFIYLGEGIFELDKWKKVAANLGPSL